MAMPSIAHAHHEMENVDFVEFDHVPSNIMTLDLFVLANLFGFLFLLSYSNCYNPYNPYNSYNPYNP